MEFGFTYHECTIIHNCFDYYLLTAYGSCLFVSGGQGRGTAAQVGTCDQGGPYVPASGEPTVGYKE